MVELYLIVSTSPDCDSNKAIVEIRRSEELDPLSLVINTGGGEFYYFARR